MATFWTLLVTFLSSAASRYLFIFILILAAAGAFYLSIQKRIALERAEATYQYNLNQLQQAIKDKDKFIDTLSKINEDKERIVSDLIQKKDELEKRLKQVEDEVNIEIGKGNDRESSSILKNVFKKLGNQQ